MATGRVSCREERTTFVVGVWCRKSLPKHQYSMTSERYRVAFKRGVMPSTHPNTLSLCHIYIPCLRFRGMPPHLASQDLSLTFWKFQFSFSLCLLCSWCKGNIYTLLYLKIRCKKGQIALTCNSTLWECLCCILYCIFWESDVETGQIASDAWFMVPSAAAIHSLCIRP